MQDNEGYFSFLLRILLQVFLDSIGFRFNTKNDKKHVKECNWMCNWIQVSPPTSIEKQFGSSSCLWHSGIIFPTPLADAFNKLQYIV